MIIFSGRQSLITRVQIFEQLFAKIGAKVVVPKDTADVFKYLVKYFEMLYW